MYSEKITISKLGDEIYQVIDMYVIDVSQNFRGIIGGLNLGLRMQIYVWNFTIASFFEKNYILSKINSLITQKIHEFVMNL